MPARSVKIPYLIERPSGFYWQPKASMRAEGFLPRALGKNSEIARREALRLYEHWCRYKDGRDTAPLPQDDRHKAFISKRYPVASIGAAFQIWIATAEWKELAPKTRNGEWWPAWTLRIDPVFGRIDPRTVTFAQLSEWRSEIKRTSGLDTAHRAIKIWRRLWKIMAALKFCDLQKDPSVAIRNEAPKGRNQRFVHYEIVRRVKEAWRQGYRGLACIIAICWDTQFSPVDVRTLRKRHFVSPEDEAPYFDRSEEGRQKTERAVIGTLSKRTERLIQAYLTWRGVELLDEAFLFHNRSGRPYREDTLADDFRDLMNKCFDGDPRQLRDIRRSGAMEAHAGEVDSKALADKMGNSINTSDKLQRVYAPVDLVNVRRADEARVKGRRVQREANSKGRKDA
jgi:hypothetical protein